MLFDTNTVIRFVMGEPEAQFLKVKAVMKNAADGKMTLQFLSFEKDFGRVDGVKWINPNYYKQRS